MAKKKTKGKNKEPEKTPVEILIERIDLISKAKLLNKASSLGVALDNLGENEALGVGIRHNIEPKDGIFEITTTLSFVTDRVKEKSTYTVDPDQMEMFDGDIE